MVPAPLFKDPVFDGAADPMIIRKESDGLFYMFYTQRRANQQVENVSYCYGSKIGVAESADGEFWYYRGALDLDFEFGQNTFWAPEIVYDPESRKYHMFVSYIRGIYCDWKGKATIEHYTSSDLFYWQHEGQLAFGSSRIIDPCLYRFADGLWRMWYKDESKACTTCYADSRDLVHWEYRGVAADDQMQEGPNVFFFGGKYFMICDVWDGLGVYSSDDGEHFSRQAENILREGSARRDDSTKGGHADIFVIKDRAFIVYFTHPEETPRTCIQMAELILADGKIFCDRGAEFSVSWNK